MPTHEEAPWERDARKHAQSGAPRGADTRSLRNAAIAVAALAGSIAIYSLTQDDDQAVVQPRVMPVAPAPAPPAADGRSRRERATRVRPASVWRITKVRSRFASREVLEIWGRTDAPDGSTIRIRISAGGASQGVVAPAAQGRFYGRSSLEPVLQGRGVSISARVAR